MRPFGRVPRAIAILAAATTVEGCDITFPDGCCPDFKALSEMPPESPGQAIVGVRDLIDPHWSPNGKTLFGLAIMAGETKRSLVAIDFPTAEVRKLVPLDSATQFAFAPDSASVNYAKPVRFVVSDPTTNGGVRIENIDLATGAVRAVYGLQQSRGMLFSRDGKTLGYVVYRVATSPDTTVVVDLATGQRIASVVDNTPGGTGYNSGVIVPRAFSADGRLLLTERPYQHPNLIETFFPPLYFTWDFAAGRRDTASAPDPRRLVRARGWGRGAFRVLYTAYGPTGGPPSPRLYDAAVGGTDSVAYPVMDGLPERVEWVPEQQVLFVALKNTVCYGANYCQLYHFSVVYLTPTSVVTLGSFNQNFIPLFTAPPDGSRIVYQRVTGELMTIQR